MNPSNYKPTFGVVTQSSLGGPNSFGQQQQSTIGAFGCTQQPLQSSITTHFGQQHTGILNTQSNPTSVFGQQKTQQSTGTSLFQSNPTSNFGQQQTQQPIGFSPLQSSITTHFGQQHTGILNTQSNPTSVFGQQKTQQPTGTSLFQSNPTSNFGQQQTQQPTGTSLFQSTSNFGQQPTGTSLFQSNPTSNFCQQQTQQPAGFSPFSNPTSFLRQQQMPQPIPCSLFDMSQPKTQNPTGSSVFQGNPTIQSSNFCQQQTQQPTGSSLFQPNAASQLSPQQPTGFLFTQSNPTSVLGQQQAQQPAGFSPFSNPTSLGQQPMAQPIQCSLFDMSRPKAQHSTGSSVFQANPTIQSSNFYQQQTQQPTGSSLFQPNAASQLSPQQPTGFLFTQSNPTSALGQQQAQQPAGFSPFSNPTSLGQQPMTQPIQCSLFDMSRPKAQHSTGSAVFQANPTIQSGNFDQQQTQQPTGSSLFQPNAASQVSPQQPTGFLFTQSNPTSVLGQQQAQQPAGFSPFSNPTSLGQQPMAQPIQCSFYDTSRPKAQHPTGSSVFQANLTNPFVNNTQCADQGQPSVGTDIKFSPVTGSDTMQKNGLTQSVFTKHYCITCMKEYEHKSVEELRCEDYSVNRKGPTQIPGLGYAPFTSGIEYAFQTDNKPIFATNNNNLFNSTTITAQPNHGLPVAQNTATNLVQKPAQSAGGFKPECTFPFPQTTPTQAPNLFNARPPVFGPSNHLGAFEKPAPTVFGPCSHSCFHNCDAIRQPLVDATVSKPICFVGNATTSTTNAHEQLATIFSVDHQSGQFSTANADDTKNVFALATDSFPDGPHVYGLEPVFKDASATNSLDAKSFLDFSKEREELAGTRSKIQVQTPKPKTEDDYNKQFFEAKVLKRLRNQKCLVIRKFIDSSSTIYNKYKTALIEAEDCSQSPNGSSIDLGVCSLTTPNSKALSSEKKSDNSTNITINHTTNLINHSNLNDEADRKLQFEDSTLDKIDSSDIKVSKPTYTLEDSVTVSSSNVNHDNAPSNTDAINPAGVILSRPEYYMYPPQQDLHQYMDENGRCMVQGLIIGRRGYGNVYYSEPVDITNMNLDEIVHFRHKEIIVYTDESTKPPVGEGLNRLAQVTLDKIYPREKGSDKYITEVGLIIQSNFAENLMSITHKHSCKFVDYRPKTGSWVFKVRHF